MGPKNIDQIEVYRVSVPLAEPWVTACGSETSVETIYLKICAGEYFGWGESCPMQYPHYSPEWSGGAFRLITEVLAPNLLGKPVGSGEDIQRLMDAVKGNPFAKAALDNAWWDLEARASGQPLWRFLGGDGEAVAAGASFGRVADVGELLRRVGKAIGAGARRIKLKFAGASDLPAVEAVRRTYPGVDTHIDCNGSLDPGQADVFATLDGFALKMVEDPLKGRDFAASADLRRRISTPICLDESIGSFEEAKRAVDLGACDWINLKPGRVGGVTEALRIYRLCRQSETGCWIGGMLESPLGVALLAAMASLPGIAYPGDFNVRNGHSGECALCFPRQKYRTPYELMLSRRPGVGVEPDIGKLKAASLERAVVT